MQVSTAAAVSPVSPPLQPALAAASAPLPAAEWEEIFRPLRAAYFKNLRAAIDWLAGAIDVLDLDRAHCDVVQEMLRQFHSWAGSGTTYGVPEVSALGAEGEKRCQAILTGDVPATDSQVEGLRALLAGLRAELAAAGAALPEPPAAPPSVGLPATVPAAARTVPAAPGATAAPATEPLASGRRARILCMEDDASQAAFIQAVLAGAGHEVRSCTDPNRFAVDLADTQPDLVLMDVVLPGTSGFELARAMGNGPAGSRPPVLFITTEGQMSCRLEAAMAGGDGYLVKPVQPGFLLTTVADRLDHDRRVQALLEYDAQTHLLTRGAILERARAAVGRKRQDARRHTSWAVIGLDAMPAINSLHGAASGDDVLERMATLLRRNLMPGESTGRYLGATFAVLLDDRRPAQALARVEQLRHFLDQTEFRSAAGRFRVTFSCGIAELAAEMSVESWVEAADGALAAARAAGGNRTVVAR